MNLVTRCPACATAFRVVPDQLKLAEGWVRCGHCGEYFDAQATLLAGGDGNEPAAPAQEAGEAGTAALAAIPLPGPVGEPVDAPAGASADVSADVSADDAKPDPGDALPPAADTPPADAEQLSMLADPPPEPRWKRVALVLLVLLLAALLLSQLVVSGRHRVAAHHPALQPLLGWLCQPLQCRVEPWRHIQSLVLDAASLQSLGEDGYRLRFSVRNNATAPVAVPSIELALQGAQGEMLVRRTVAPADYGFAGDRLAPGAEFSASALFRLAAASGEAPRIADYRIYAFYP